MMLWLLGLLAFLGAWRGITVFCCYWCEMEQRRMPGPRAAGIKHRRVS